MISLSYSRISLADIAQKLQLDSPEDAEFIVAKVTFTLPKRNSHTHLHRDMEQIVCELQVYLL